MATIRHLCGKATVTLAGLAAAAAFCSGCGQDPSSTGGLSRTATQPCHLISQKPIKCITHCIMQAMLTTSIA